MVDLSKEQFNADQKQTYSALTWIGLGLVLLFALWLRLPFISTGLPFFYQEDEGHHFNRTVEMVKRGQWNPEYFHKPSLHFYLRMPVVGLSFLHAVREGHIRSVREIRTRDSFGLAGYSFTASHSGIVKWNRALSVLFSLLMVIGTFSLCMWLTRSPPASLIAASLVAVSPDLIVHSAIIGVDILMAMMSLLAVMAAVYAVKKGGLVPLATCGLLCGLALSSKYNAAPILLLPLVVWCLQSSRLMAGFFVAALTPIFGFILGSPFVLASFPLFLDHMAYEVWHYGVAGHVGHSEEPGLPQLLFYLNWLGSSAFGWIALGLAGLGLVLVIVKPSRTATACVFFPLLFLLFMVMQKTNFARNMLVIIPFLSVFVGLLLAAAFSRIKSKGVVASVVTVILLACLMAQPLALAIQERDAAIAPAESRIAFMDWLRDFSAQEGQSGELAVAGQLQLPADSYLQPRVMLEDFQKNDILDLYLLGYSYAAAGNLDDFLFDVRREVVSFDGVPGRQRILRNPRIELWELPAEGAHFGREVVEERIVEQERYQLFMVEEQPGSFKCPEQGGAEGHCWISSRVSLLNFDFQEGTAAERNFQTVVIKLMNPWRDQQIAFSVGDFSQSFDLESDAENFKEIILTLPEQRSLGSDPLFVELAKVLSPRVQAVSDDPRRLGVAVKSIKIF